MNIKKYKVTSGKGFRLSDYETKETGGFESAADVQDAAGKNKEELAELQSRLYAEGKTAVLIIFQAMDAAGKDSSIKHVMSGVNPQGVDVYSFKQPSAEELSHDYLWRAAKELPSRGKIGIFNRSYYEDVLVVKVHKLYESQNLPDRCKGGDTIAKRYKQIRHFEDYLWENGVVTVKFFINLSKETQRKRFLERIDQKDKNWKFSEADIKERQFWDDYQDAYQRAIKATATEKNPWYVVPADKKWYTQYVISEVLLNVMKDINPKYPELTPEGRQALEECRKALEEN